LINLLNNLLTCYRAVTWYKGVRELTYSERYRIMAQNDGHFMMQIPSTMKQDSGEFSIVASNSIGSVKFTALVNVLPPRPGVSPADLDWSVARRAPDSSSEFSSCVYWCGRFLTPYMEWPSPVADNAVPFSSGVTTY